MKFKGKISPWWQAITGVFNVILIAAIYISGVSYTSFVLIVLFLIPDLYLIPVLFKNEVTVNKNEVLVQFGLLRKRVAVKEITVIKNVTNLSTSFAATFDRLEISTTTKMPFYISLEDHRGFVQEVRKYNRKTKYLIG